VVALGRQNCSRSDLCLSPAPDPVRSGCLAESRTTQALRVRRTQRRSRVRSGADSWPDEPISRRTANCAAANEAAHAEPHCDEQTEATFAVLDSSRTDPPGHRSTTRIGIESNDDSSPSSAPLARLASTHQCRVLTSNLKNSRSRSSLAFVVPNFEAFPTRANITNCTDQSMPGDSSCSIVGKNPAFVAEFPQQEARTVRVGEIQRLLRRIPQQCGISANFSRHDRESLNLRLTVSQRFSVCCDSRRLRHGACNVRHRVASHDFPKRRAIAPLAACIASGPRQRLRM
jgi:hypothetical protein